MTNDPALLAVLDQLCATSHEDWDVDDDGALLLDGVVVLHGGSREFTLNYMLAYIAGIQCAWRDFAVHCPALGSC